MTSNVFHSSFLFFFFIICLFYHFFIIKIIFAAFDSLVRFFGLLSISCDTCLSFCTECDLGLTEKVLCGLQRFSQIAFEHCKLKPFVCPKKTAFFKVLSQQLHIIEQFLLITWTFKLLSVSSHQYTSSHDWSYYCTGSSFHSVCR